MASEKFTSEEIEEWAMPDLDDAVEAMRAALKNEVTQQVALLFDEGDEHQHIHLSVSSWETPDDLGDTVYIEAYFGDGASQLSIRKPLFSLVRDYGRMLDQPQAAALANNLRELARQIDV